MVEKLSQEVIELLKSKQTDSAALDKVTASPADFALMLSGHHDHPACNGKYLFVGMENGKTKWEKAGDSSIKVFWTGHSWDCFWGGYSPEAWVNTPVPPLTGYDFDKRSTEIVVKYEYLKANNMNNHDNPTNSCYN